MGRSSAGAASAYGSSPSAGSGRLSAAPAAASSVVAVSSPSRAPVVHVAGAVRHPGVYRLAAGARVQDAVRRAGGPTGKADVNAINLAAVVQDGVQVVVPARGPAGAVAAPISGDASAGVAAPTAPVNLNTATAEQLDTLDGVGPATAQKILDYRRQHGGFRSVEDLGQVPGIGPKKLAALRSKVQV
jgi:competence protein ComEA